MKYTQIFKGYRKVLWLIILSLLIGLLVALFSGSLQIKKNFNEEISLDYYIAHMNERIPVLMKLYQIPGCSIALVQDCEIVWTQSYGYADVDSGRSLTADTPMSVQSITKSITAWGVMKLVENNLIDLDAPLSNYLTSWGFTQNDYSIQKITIRRLLNHTSGMPLGDFTVTCSPGEEMPSLRERLTQEAILLHEPGTKFSYSNTGYHLLELLIEEVSGQSFSEHMSMEVLLPLDMKTSTFDVDNTTIPYPPTGYNLNGDLVPVYVYPEKASGGLFASVKDIAKFVAAGMKENPIIKAESIEQMYTSENNKIGIYNMVFDAYGLGHYIETLSNGLYSVSHGGQGNGIMTHFQAVPETGDAIVILTNSQRSWLFISYLLSDWKQLCSLPSIGMEMIIWGHYGMSVVIGMLISTSILIVFNLIFILYNHEQIDYKVFRIVIALIMQGILIWSACQKYLFISSVFPILTVWLESAVVVLSIILLLSALLPNSRIYFK